MGLRALNVEWVDRAMAQTSHQRVILDMDSSESPVHGQARGSRLQRPLRVRMLSSALPVQPFRRLRRCNASTGATSTALSDGWEVLEPVVKRYQEKGVRLLFRADAAFAKPEVYEYLESRDTGYAMRLPANEVLQRNIRHLLKRPVGRPPKKPVVRYHDFVYQAQSWDIPRRVVAKVEWHQGELFPRGRVRRHQPQPTARRA